MRNEHATKKDVARFFDIQPQTVDSWMSQGMPHQPGTGGRNPAKFVIQDCARWLARRRSSSKHPRIEAAEIRIAEEKAKTAEITTQRLIGRLVLRDKYEGRIADLLGFLRREVDVARRTLGPEATETWLRIIDDVSERFFAAEGVSQNGNDHDVE